MDYDLIVIGGGLGGSSVARYMAAAGAKVLVVEREQRFRDRVRGDMVYPWGAAEARQLGVLEEIMVPLGQRIATWSTTIEPLPAADRDIAATSPSGEQVVTFYHPRLQEALLEAAAAAGADVRRGTAAVGVQVSERSGGAVTVTLRGHEPGAATAAAGERLSARLVVGADGRDSAVRVWAGFHVAADAPRLVLAGTVLRGVAAPPGAGHVFLSPSRGLLTVIFPVGDGRHRVYGGYELGGGRRQLSGTAALPAFLDMVVASGAPAAWFEQVKLDGPLAAFDGADRWVETPYRDGVVLVGDAAAATDPSFGCGVALTLRDARVLVEELTANDDWPAAATTYAREHDRYYGALHRIVDWLTRIYRETGPEADARRRRVYPLLAADGTRVPDVLGLGPESPSDETARRRFFGEE